MDNIAANADLITNSRRDGTVAPFNLYAAELKPGDVVNGDVTIGAGGDPLSKAIYDDTIVVGAGNITGSKKVLSKTRSPYEVPDIAGILPYRGSLIVPNNGAVTISVSGEYDSIVLGNKATLTITKDAALYVDGTVDFGAQSKFIIVPAATVSLVLNDDLTFGAQSEMENQSQDPKKFTVYCTNNVTSFDLASHATFFGNMYMPSAEFTVASGTQFFGSILGKTVDLSSNVGYHFDESLVDDPNAPTFNKYNLLWWQSD